MQNKVLLTPIDQLVDFVKEKERVSTEEIINYLKLPENLIEKWLVVLDEAGVLSVNYQGLKGFVKFVKKDKVSDNLDVDEIKSKFISACKNRGYDYDDISKLWTLFVDNNLDDFKKEFYRVSKLEGYQDRKISKAWTRYLEDLRKF